MSRQNAQAALSEMRTVLQKYKTAVDSLSVLYKQKLRTKMQIHHNNYNLALLEVLKDTDVQDAKVTVGNLREEICMWAAVAQAESIDVNE